MKYGQACKFKKGEQMQTPIQVIEKINRVQLALQQGNSELKTLAIKKAKAERDYRIALARKILILKAEKYPVTLIQELSKGDEEVAELKLQRDVSESAYFTAISAMENLRLEIESLRSTLAWLKEEYKNS